MKTVYPSLNLAQAVMVYAYELSMINSVNHTEESERDEDEYRSLKKRVGEFLERYQIDRNQVLYHRIFERLSLLKEEDIHLLHSVYKYSDMP